MSLFHSSLPTMISVICATNRPRGSRTIISYLIEKICKKNKFLPTRSKCYKAHTRQEMRVAMRAIYGSMTTKADLAKKHARMMLAMHALFVS